VSAVFRVQGTSPDLAFDRVLRETSGHYLLGVEGSEADRDGRAHPIRGEGQAARRARPQPCQRRCAPA
jgi:hypothetical protein